MRGVAARHGTGKRLGAVGATPRERETAVGWAQRPRRLDRRDDLGNVAVLVGRDHDEQPDRARDEVVQAVGRVPARHVVTRRARQALAAEEHEQ